MDSRRLGIPASFFGIVLGLVGLGNCWREAHRLWGLPAAIGETVLLVSAIVWLLLIVLYVRRWIAWRDDALGEVRHPIQCCFVSLVPVSTMLMALVALPYSRDLALVFFGVGSTGALVFGVWRHGALWRGGRTPGTTTPVLYLPTVAANFVTAIVASALGWPEWGMLFFGAGLLAWLAVESVILHRLLTAEEMPPPLRPTLGIHLAPAAVGMLALTSVTGGTPSLFASALLGYALLQALLLLRLLPWISEVGFGAGYWAFTFGVTAMTLGCERLTGHGAGAPVALLAPVLFVIANALIVFLFVASLFALARGRFLPLVPTAPPPAP